MQLKDYLGSALMTNKYSVIVQAHGYQTDNSNAWEDDFAEVEAHIEEFEESEEEKIPQLSSTKRAALSKINKALEQIKKNLKVSSLTEKQKESIEERLANDREKLKKLHNPIEENLQKRKNRIKTGQPENPSKRVGSISPKIKKIFN